MNTKPYYAILLILIFFVFLWFFCGGGEYEFIGLKPLQTSVCVDNTPIIPPEYIQTVCIDKPQVSKGEKVCRDTMEKIYGVPFTNQRPTWLKNITGHCLELDCYNEALKLAVEYNGEQHYKWPNYFHKTYKSFKDQLDRDQLKIKLCQDRGVHLIVVPYNVSVSLIPAYIKQHLPEKIQQFL